MLDFTDYLCSFVGYQNLKALIMYTLQKWNGMEFEDIASYKYAAIPLRRWAEMATDGVLGRVLGNIGTVANSLPGMILHWGGDNPQGHKLFLSILKQNHILQWDMVIPSSTIQPALQAQLANLGCIVEYNRIVHLPQKAYIEVPRGFARMLREHRIKRGLLQREVAALVGVVSPTITSIEGGLTKAGPALAKRLSELFEDPKMIRTTFVIK